MFDDDQALLFGYADFLRLYDVDEMGRLGGYLELRSAGVFLIVPHGLQLLTEERALLTEDHPTGNISEAVLSFPFNLVKLKDFQCRYGWLCGLDPFVLLELVRGQSKGASEFAPSVKVKVDKNERTAGEPRSATMLRIIRALVALTEMPDRRAVSKIVTKLEELGFRGPGKDTVRSILESARELEVDL